MAVLKSVHTCPYEISLQLTDSNDLDDRTTFHKNEKLALEILKKKSASLRLWYGILRSGGFPFVIVDTRDIFWFKQELLLFFPDMITVTTYTGYN